MSNSNSSFDADISDDSQFLEKLEEINQQAIEEENKKLLEKNKAQEMNAKCVDQSEAADSMKNQILPNVQPSQIQSQQQQQQQLLFFVPMSSFWHKGFRFLENI